MNISSVTTQPYSPIPFNSQPNVSSASGSGPTASGVTSDLSNTAQLFNQLKQLSTQNPSQFEQVTGQIAQQLTAAAKSATDPNQAAALMNLASNFTQASQTGQFSSLFSQPSSASASVTQPQGFHAPSAGGHHHHHGGGGHGYEAQSSDASSTQSTLESILSSELNPATPPATTT